MRQTSVLVETYISVLFSPPQIHPSLLPSSSHHHLNTQSKKKIRLSWLTSGTHKCRKFSFSRKEGVVARSWVGQELRPTSCVTVREGEEGGGGERYHSCKWSFSNYNVVIPTALAAPPGEVSAWWWCASTKKGREDIYGMELTDATQVDVGWMVIPSLHHGATSSQSAY